MGLRYHTIENALGLSGAGLSGSALVQFNEGLTAFKNVDYAQAAQKFQSLVDRSINIEVN